LADLAFPEAPEDASAEADRFVAQDEVYERIAGFLGLFAAGRTSAPHGLFGFGFGFGIEQTEQAIEKRLAAAPTSAVVVARVPAGVASRQRHANGLGADRGSVEQFHEAGGGAGGNGGGRGAALDGDRSDLISRQLADLLDQPYNRAFCGAGRQGIELQLNLIHERRRGERR
jgi:hypothetical protein